MGAPAIEEIGHRKVARAPLDEALQAAEESTLAGLAAVREALRHALLTVTSGSAEEADQALAHATELATRYDDIHQQLIALIARQAPVACDLPLAIALLHVNDRLERRRRSACSPRVMSRERGVSPSTISASTSATVAASTWPSANAPTVRRARSPSCSP